MRVLLSCLLVSLAVCVLQARADWVMTEDIPTGAYTKALASNGTLIFAGTGGAGVFVSSNDGKKWTAISTGITDKNISSLLVSNGNVYAVSSELYRTTNNGESWSTVSAGSNYRIFDIAANATSLFASVTDNTTFKVSLRRSNDNGVTWDSLPLPLSGGKLIIDNNKLIYLGRDASFQFGSAVSNDNGSTWTTGSSTGAPQTIAVYTFAGNRLLVGGDMNGVAKSDDGGATWSEANTGLAKGLVGGLWASGSSAIAAVQQKSIYSSTDGGNTWTDASQGIGGARAFSALVLHNGKFFTLLMSGELYRREMKEMVVGVEEEEMVYTSSLDVTPMPATSRVHVHLAHLTAAPQALQLCDVQGQTVWSATLVPDNQNEIQTTITTDNLARGIYVLRVVCDANHTLTSTVGLSRVIVIANE